MSTDKPDEREKYNIALVPSPEVCGEFWDYAAHWKTSANGYFIERGGAFPHITLCRFFAPSGSAMAARRLQENVINSIGNNSLEIVLSELAIATGKKKEEKNLLLWFNAKPTTALMAAQKTTVELITAAGFEPSGLDVEYQPHVTICIAPEAVLLSGLPSPTHLMRAYPMSISVGVSGKNGMLMSVHNQLTPAPSPEVMKAAFENVRSN